MIIIKIIILYFIQIRHPDDFPSTGTRLVFLILLKYVCLSVDVSKLQFAILARSSREMSQIVRID